MTKERKGLRLMTKNGAFFNALVGTAAAREMLAAVRSGDPTFLIGDDFLVRVADVSIAHLIDLDEEEAKAREHAVKQMRLQYDFQRQAQAAGGAGFSFGK